MSKINPGLHQEEEEMSRQRSREVGRAAMGRKDLTLTTQTPTRVCACPCPAGSALGAGHGRSGGGTGVAGVMGCSGRSPGYSYLLSLEMFQYSDTSLSVTQANSVTRTCQVGGTALGEGFMPAASS